MTRVWAEIHRTLIQYLFVIPQFSAFLVKDTFGVVGCQYRQLLIWAFKYILPVKQKKSGFFDHEVGSRFNGKVHTANLTSLVSHRDLIFCAMGALIRPLLLGFH